MKCITHDLLTRESGFWVVIFEQSNVFFFENENTIW